MSGTGILHCGSQSGKMEMLIQDKGGERPEAVWTGVVNAEV